MEQSQTDDSAADVLNSLRIDLKESLQQSSLDPRCLSSFQRILLTTDGTVTDILEAQFWEAIRIVKVYQDIVQSKRDIPYLDVMAGQDILLRKVLLRGRTTHKNYIYAESITVIDNLDEHLRDGLLNTGKPIGQLMLESRLETFREILVVRSAPAGEEVGGYFNISPDDQLITRTYRVYSWGKPIMLITETFPESSFKD